MSLRTACLPCVSDGTWSVNAFGCSTFEPFKPGWPACAHVCCLCLALANIHRSQRGADQGKSTLNASTQARKHASTQARKHVRMLAQPWLVDRPELDACFCSLNHKEGCALTHLASIRITMASHRRPLLHTDTHCARDTRRQHVILVGHKALPLFDELLCAGRCLRVKCRNVPRL